MMQEPIARTLRSGELAKAGGVSVDTIRHYEKIGILPRALRTHGGYRMYPESAVERVRVVRRALRIGFSLSELADIMKERDAGGAPCERVYELAQQKLAQFTEDIERMQQTASFLRVVLNEWNSRLHKSAPGKRAQLLYSLSLAPDPGPQCNRTFRRRSSS